MKGLGTRAYNILFHTHTVSGIVISVVLFVIFLAGAISLYKQEIYQWENPAARGSFKGNINYERLITRLDSLKSGVQAADEIRIVLPTDARPVYTVYAPVESTSGIYYATFVYNPIDDRVNELFFGNGNSSTTGDTLYRLHFLDQVPLYIGRYIAGFVSLFFAFAIITGVLIHWKNIVSKFYAFSFKQMKKQFSTNAHTVFGIIGLPFQLMYAITGAFYMLSVFILAPAVVVLFKGDQDKLVTEIYPQEAFHEHDAKPSKVAHLLIGEGLQQIRKDYPDHQVSYLEIINPGKQKAALGADLKGNTNFNEDGVVVLDLYTAKYKLEIKPGEKNYRQSILQGISKLHFGNFGGWLLKALYFILSVFTCFVIISGVLIWKEARNKATYTNQQRRFHHSVTMAYLSICFGLFPATAILFNAEQLVPNGAGHADLVNRFFFISWLVLSVLGFFLKSEKHITKYGLMLGGLLSCLVPLSNGIITGDWLWNSISKYQYVFITDLVWLLTGLLSLMLAYTMQKKNKTA